MQKNIIILWLFFLANLTFSQEKSILKTYNKLDLLIDYDLLVSSLKEAHPGLYWYTNYATYEKIFEENRNRIKDGMNSYEFFRIISRIVSADREGHSDAFRSSNIATYFNNEAKLLPIAIKKIQNKLYVINNIGTNKTKGCVLKKIDEVPIDTILKKIVTYKSKYPDGYSLTGQYKNLDYFNFISSYPYYIDNFKKDSLPVELYYPKIDKTRQLKVSLIKKDSLLQIAPNYHIEPTFTELINGIDSQLNYVNKLIKNN